jgi:formylglycine-generating enzyme required for sulfatase activity
MLEKTILRGSLVLALLLPAVSAQANLFNLPNVFNMPGGQTSLQFVTVGNPGNVADTNGYGSVPYVYQMGEYDVTAAQYCVFLNAVATTGDPYGLYYSRMAAVGGAGNGGTSGCGIIQNGAAGNYTYTVAAAYANFPVNYITWGDAARFCNWLQNGQRSGPEGNGTTEMGAYTLSGDTSNLNSETRNPGATYFIPSENEWYKAAYYVGGGTNAGYWSYPTSSNTAPVNTLPDTGNHANFYDDLGTGNGGYTDPTNLLTPVGSFDLSPGPYGAYDMGGDVWQWNETDNEGSFRGLRGGSYFVDSDVMESSFRNSALPTAEHAVFGFRVAASSVAVPEPGGIALFLAGAVAFGIWRLRVGMRRLLVLGLFAILGILDQTSAGVIIPWTS